LAGHSIGTSHNLVLPVLYDLQMTTKLNAREFLGETVRFARRSYRYSYRRSATDKYDSLVVTSSVCYFYRSDAQPGGAKCPKRTEELQSAASDEAKSSSLHRDSFRQRCPIIIKNYDEK
jgi:hypothetical protein